MMSFFRFLFVWLLACCSFAHAEVRLSVCYNYGCLTQEEVVFDESHMDRLAALLLGAQDAATERERLALAVGWLLGWAGEQTPIRADRGGNFADDAVPGKMDCIDHSTTTTRLLKMLELRGWIRFHRVLEPALRRQFLVFEHYSALIEESRSGVATADEANDGRYVVDSWFLDNGRPAVVLPLAVWKAGGGADVGE